MPTVYVQIQDPRALPYYASPLSAGMDLRTIESFSLWPGETRLVRTGLSIAIPEGMEVQVRPRSGLSLKTTLRLSNSPGTIDADYRDEIGLILTNSFAPGHLPFLLFKRPDLAEQVAEVISYRDFLHRHGKSEWIERLPEELLQTLIPLREDGEPLGTLNFEAGERLAQIVLARYERIQWEVVPSVREIGEDRGGGFGHSGHI